MNLFKFEKRCQLLVGANDESLSVVAVCVATKIVRPLESIVATQPQLQPARLRLSAMISPYFTVAICPMRRAVDSRKSRADKQLVQVASVCGGDDCVISPNRAAAECTPPPCVDRERLCERLFCELACLAQRNYRWRWVRVPVDS